MRPRPRWGSISPERVGRWSGLWSARVNGCKGAGSISRIPAQSLGLPAPQMGSILRRQFSARKGRVGLSRGERGDAPFSPAGYIGGRPTRLREVRSGHHHREVAMDEDMAGLTRMLTGSSLGRCARCGTPSRHRRYRRGAHGGDHEELCERCYRSVVRDGQPAELPEEE
jgi:hypothetical protein